MLRGRKEPTSLRFSDFVLGVKREGPYSGREYLELKGLRTDKTRKLTLQNPVLRDEQGFHDMVADDNDPHCIVKLFKLFRRHFPSDYGGTILRRQVPRKHLRRIPPHADGFQPMADTVTNTGAFGINYISKICENVVLRCKLEGKRTPAGRRRSGISQQSFAGYVPANELVTSARHKSVMTTTEYQAKNEASHSLCHKAMMYDPVLAASRAGVCSDDHDAAAVSADKASPLLSIESPRMRVEKKRIPDSTFSTGSFSTQSSVESYPEQHESSRYHQCGGTPPPPMMHPMPNPYRHMQPIFNPAMMALPAYGGYYQPMMPPPMPYTNPMYYPVQQRCVKTEKKHRVHTPTENPYRRSNKKR